MHIKPFTQLCAFLALLLLSACLSENTPKQDNAEAPMSVVSTADNAQLASFTIAPPLQDVNVDFQQFRIDPTKSETIELESGSTLEIPASAFVNKSGATVTTPVTLIYREIRTPAEIISSGIPMHLTDEEGHTKWMQTAGMFEINGFAEGEEIFIADGKNLAVNMTSGVDGNYDFWYLDNAQNNWVRQGNNQAAPNPNISAGSQTARKPNKPIAFDRSKLSLNFDLNYDAFPELKDQRGIVWQYAGKDETKDPKNNNWIFDEEWTDIKLERGKNPGTYQMTLSAGKKNYSIPVHPSQKELDYQTSMEKYQREMAAYQAQLASRELHRQEEKFLRSMQISRFGVYNYDIMWKEENAIPLVADFDFGDLREEMKEQITVYLITGDKRVVVAYPSHDWGKFRFDPAQDNRLLAILPGNRLATFSQQEFNGQMDALKAARDQVYQFQMEIQDLPVQTVAQVDQVIL